MSHSSKMKKNILLHPTFQNAEDIVNICQPLERLDITYFSHVHLDKEGNFTVLAKNPAFVRRYLERQYYHYDIQMGHANDLGEYIIWDTLELNGKTLELNRESAEFGIKHLFTIIEKNSDGYDYYYFATDKHHISFNQIYFANLDLLKLFIAYFKDKIKQSKELITAYDLQFHLDKTTQAHGVKINYDFSDFNNKRSLFLSEIGLSTNLEIAKNQQLSRRELEILMWLHYGKTAKEMALILNVAEITVNKHIANIKGKIQCYTQFQLGEFFAKTFHPSKDILDQLADIT